jgi:sulfate permease, SulP family
MWAQGEAVMPMGSQFRDHALLPDWMASYRKEWLRPDVLAGLTTAAIVIPKAMAYATIAGLPVQIGLYTAFLPLMIYAVLGTSRVLSVSTTTTLAILAAAELGEVAPSGDPKSLLVASATLTALVGAMLVIAGVLRLGFVANFISEPVLIGFKAGIGVVIVVDQVPKILGIHFPRGTFLHSLVAIVQNIPHTQLATLTLGFSMVAILILVEKIAPKAPAPLIAVAAGIAAAYLLSLEAHGIQLVGKIPKGLPPVTVPDLSLISQLWPGALGIALMSFTETIAAGRAFARNDEPVPQANRELLATGLASGVAAFFGAMTGGGGTSQTAVNRLAGARTQLSALVTAGMALITMLLLAPLIGIMPQATLAAIVIVYSIGLIQPWDFIEILRVRRTEFIWALIAFAGVMLLGTLKGIIVAIIVSLVALAFQVASPPVYVLGRKPGTNVFRPRSDEHPQDVTYPGLLLVKPEGRIFFANAGNVGQKVTGLIQDARPTVVVLDLSSVFDLEYTALKMLTEGEKRYREQGVQLWLVGLTPRVRAMVEHSLLAKALGQERMQFNLEVAVEKYIAMSGKAATGKEVNNPESNPVSPESNAIGV